jgi:hypothetical protein
MTRWSGPAVSGTENGIDFDAHYTVAGQPGVAFWLHGWAVQHVPEEYVLDCEDGGCMHDDPACYLYSEPEQVPDYDWVRAVMTGDDCEHLVDITDLTPLADDGFCAGCGQTGCTADIRR